VTVGDVILRSLAGDNKLLVLGGNCNLFDTTKFAGRDNRLFTGLCLCIVPLINDIKFCNSVTMVDLYITNILFIQMIQ
jgi:hypothetical protein